MTDYQSASADELQAMIINAEKALRNIQLSKRKEIMAEIKELAASIGMTVELSEVDKKPVRKSGKVAIKYRDPNNDENTWTGRGVMPRWLKALLDQGRERSEFEI